MITLIVPLRRITLNQEVVMKSKVIAYRHWFPWLRFYVASVPGKDGDKDWGYTRNSKEAIPLSEYWQRRFLADCRRVNSVANFMIRD